MSKRSIVVLVVVALLGAGGATAVLLTRARASADDQQSCVAAQQRAEAVVHTDPLPDLPKLRVLGAYTSVQWQMRAPQACTDTAGREQRTYQAVVRLRPADARALAKKYEWLPADAFDANGMWPGLAQLVPPGTRWRTSWQLDDVLLDPGKAVAYVFLD